MYKTHVETEIQLFDLLSTVVPYSRFDETPNSWMARWLSTVTSSTEKLSIMIKTDENNNQCLHKNVHNFSVMSTTS